MKKKLIIWLLKLLGHKYYDPQEYIFIPSKEYEICKLRGDRKVPNRDLRLVPLRVIEEQLVVEIAKKMYADGVIKVFQAPWTGPDKELCTFFRADISVVRKIIKDL